MYKKKKEEFDDDELMQEVTGPSNPSGPSNAFDFSKPKPQEKKEEDLSDDEFTSDDDLYTTKPVLRYSSLL